MKDLELLECNRCGWVHAKVSKASAEAAVNGFNKFFDSLDAKQKRELYSNKKASLDEYVSCHYCGNIYTNFQIADNKPVQKGFSVPPILDPEAEF